MCPLLPPSHLKQSWFFLPSCFPLLPRSFSSLLLFFYSTPFFSFSFLNSLAAASSMLFVHILHLLIFKFMFVVWCICARVAELHPAPLHRCALCSCRQGTAPIANCPILSIPRGQNFHLHSLDFMKPNRCWMGYVQTRLHMRVIYNLHKHRDGVLFESHADIILKFISLEMTLWPRKCVIIIIIKNVVSFSKGSRQQFAQKQL